MKSWVLAKPGEVIEWYEYELDYNEQDKPEYSLSKILHSKNVVMHATKESAKHAAEKLGLKSWRYVMLN